MNGKPDEHLDQWVRQSLDRLPDAPPPGTTFDAERLWSQLRPELQKPATRRRLGWAGWLAAACAVGTVLGWFWMSEQPEHKPRIASKVERQRVPVSINPESRSMAQVDQPKSKFPTKIRPSVAASAQHSERIATASPIALPIEKVAQAVDNVTELPTIADTTSAITTQTESVKTTAAALKRRFRVVHINELQAEEAIRPTPQRTDRFVRLGTGDNGQPAPETAHPTLTWPLINKSNQ